MDIDDQWIFLSRLKSVRLHDEHLYAVTIGAFYPKLLRRPKIHFLLKSIVEVSELLFVEASA